MGPARRSFSEGGSSLVSGPAASAPRGRGLAPVRVTLDNGAVVIVRETRKTPAVSINLAVRAGSVCDPPDAPGATHLVGRVIDRGTTTRSLRRLRRTWRAVASR
jgi:predicted Zn-dependent peptidase